MNISCDGSGKYNSEKVKTWLSEYRSRWRDIETQDEMLRRLNARMTSTSAQDLNGMPHSQNTPSDKMAMMVYRKEKIEGKLKRLIELQNDQCDMIEEIISCLRNVDERSVIQFRYLSDLNWDEVSCSMFGKNDDFEDRKESYLRRSTKAHGRALSNIAKIMNERHFEVE